MDNITSQSVKTQLDYKIMMQYINNILDKENTGPGSILVGKEYADKYLSKINEMLSSEYVNMEILRSLSIEVLPDLTDIRADCKKRNYCNQHVKDNDNMMSIIIDFILTLYHEKSINELIQ